MIGSIGDRDLINIKKTFETAFQKRFHIHGCAENSDILAKQLPLLL